jgi:DNA-binding transcriptional regulator YdaS (Cro superfamily)
VGLIAPRNRTRPFWWLVAQAQNVRNRTIARGLDVHEVTVSHWATGREDVPPGRRPQIAALLGVPEDELFPEALED